MSLKCRLGIHNYKRGAMGMLYCVDCHKCTWDSHELVKNLDRDLPQVHPILRGEGLEELAVKESSHIDAMDPATDLVISAADFKSIDEITDETHVIETRFAHEDFAAPEMIVDRDLNAQFLADDFMSPDELMALESKAA